MFVIREICMWTGVIVLTTGAVIGLSELGILVFDKLIKSLGLWPEFYEAMRTMYRERSKSRPAG